MKAQYAYYKVKKTRDGRRWMIWGALQRLTGDDPIHEPADPVWFDFAATEEEAEKKFTAEMEAACGPLRWWRQPVEEAAADCFSIPEINRKHRLRQTLREARDHARCFPLRRVADVCHDLREVCHHQGVLPMLVETAEKQGMRLDEADLVDGDSERLNDHIVIFRGHNLHLVDRILQGAVKFPPVEE